MRSKYNRFLLSTCLPVLAVSLFNMPNAHAGFEWTPPEKAPVVDVVPQPVETMDAVVPDDVMTESLPDLVDDMADSPETEPPIEIKVMDDEPSVISEPLDTPELQTEKADMSEIEHAVDAIDHEVMPEKPDMVEDVEIEDVVVIQEPENTQLEPVAINDEPMEEITEIAIEPQTTEIIEDVAPAQDMEAKQAPTSLSINPYPQENDTAAAAETVVIPDDSEKTLTEMTSDDVVNDAGNTPLSAPVTKEDPITWNERETFDVIEGFGKDIPLALALRQIVPAKYAYKFGDDLDAGARVSWTGGAPWNEVLSNALAPLNVDYTIKGNRILLETIAADTANQEMAPMSDAVILEEEAVMVEDVAEPIEEEIAIIEDAAMEDATNDVVVEDEPIDVKSDVGDDIDSVTDALLNAEEHGHMQESDVLSPADKLNQQSLETMKTAPEKAEVVIEDAPEIVEEIAIEEVEADVETAPMAEKSPLDDIYGESDTEETLLEEILEPIEVMEEDVKSIPAPSNEKLNEVNIERQKVIDPGPEAGVQPNVSEFQQTEPSPVQKKNEVNGNLDDALKQLEKQSAFDNAEGAPIALSALTDQGVIETESPADKTSLNEITPAAEAPNDIAQDVAQTKQALEDDIIIAHAEQQSDASSNDGFMKEPSNKIRIWEAKRGMSLERIMKKWQDVENVQIIWDTSDNYKLSKDIFISGTFQNAVDVLFSQGFKGGPQYRLQDDHYALHIMADN